MLNLKQLTTICPEKAREGARFCHHPHPAVCYGNKVIKRNVGPVGAKNCISSNYGATDHKQGE